MSRILDSKVIKTGKIIDNYLVNFPQFINKEKDSIYKLVIGQKVTCFVVNITDPNTIVTLPYGRFGQNHAQFISWGDDINRRTDDPDMFLVHNYKTPGIYQIYILGDTPDLWNIYDYVFNEYEALNTRLEEIEKRLITINEEENPTQEFIDEKNNLLSEQQNIISQINVLEQKQQNEWLGFVNFFNCLIQIRKLCDSLTNLWGTFKRYPNLSSIPDEPLPRSVSSCISTFCGCSKLEYIPFNFDLPEECTNFENMFSWSGLKAIFNQDLKLPYKTSNVDQMFRGTKLESVPQRLFNNVTSALTCTSGMFKDCSNLMYFTSNKKLEYITNINEMFQFCTSLKEVTFNVPNLTSLYATCSGCSSLNKIEGFHINQFTKNADHAFSDCYSLNQDVGQILEYWTDFNLTHINSTFFNCLQLRGTPKEQYLWKSYTLGHLSTNTFHNCTLLNNYNFITTEWGGPDDVNYWYGSFEIQIKDPDEDIYCLPIYKFLYGDKDSQQNQNYSIFTEESGILAPYDFYINYGDEGAWYHVTIGDNLFFNSFWQNDKNSPLYGYPKTWQVNFKSNDENLEKQQDKIQAYNNLINNNFFGYIYKNIMHKYETSGNYKIMIMGQIPRLYVHHTDYQTNRLLFDIYTVNKLPFTSLDHAFTNAINLRYLPNEQLKFFPILSGESNWQTVQSTISGWPSNPLCSWPIWRDNTGKNCIISTAVDTYSYYENNSWVDNYVIEEVHTLSAVTEVVISSLTRNELLHEIPESATNYCFANGNGLDDYLNAKPPLFDININNTTFANRK